MDTPIPGFPRLTTDPRKLGGKPVVRGLRISVRDVLRALATYPTRAELFEDFPDLTDEDLDEVLAFAAAMTDGREERWEAAG